MIWVIITALIINAGGNVVIAIMLYRIMRRINNILLYRESAAVGKAHPNETKLRVISPYIKDKEQ